MGKVRVVTAEEGPFIRARDRRDRDRSNPAGPSDEEIDGTSIRFHHPGAADQPQLFEVRVDPGVEVSTHAHGEDEIIAVIEGELRLGAKVCRAGSSIFVEGRTLYGFKAGPEGARFLNFRPRVDHNYWNKQAFLALHRETQGQEGSPSGKQASDD
jgi:quercetin dioxygenase-like cupin family protein